MPCMLRVFSSARSLAAVTRTVATSRLCSVLLPSPRLVHESWAGPGSSTSQQLCQQMKQRITSQRTYASAGPQADQHGYNHSSSSGSKVLLTLPTLLTLARVAAVPVLIGAWFWPSQWSALVCTVVFVIAALTDWLDGYLARKMDLHSEFGAFLDPVADKLMVAAVLILISTQPLAMGLLKGNDWLMPVLTLAIIGREITMSALREWAAGASKEARKAVAVNNWGKWKTATQMTALALLLACKDGGQGLILETAANLGPALLVVAAWLTVQSLAIYIRGLWRFIVQ